MTETNPVREHANETFAAAAAGREKQQFVRVHHLGAQGDSDPGRHYANYANMISNRILVLYDDAAVLLTNERMAASCVIARCMLETYAVGRLSLKDVSKALEKDGSEKALEVVLAYINSSRVKVEEQKRFKAREFSANDYHFTPQALARMQNEEAVSKHILNAMRNLFADEMEVTGKKVSKFEMVYEHLCEWTHPSQTSLFHAFAEETWMIPTSIGPISLWDSALSSCAEGMHCVTAVPELREAMNLLAENLTLATTGGAKPK